MRGRRGEVGKPRAQVAGGELSESTAATETMLRDGDGKPDQDTPAKTKAPRLSRAAQNIATAKVRHGLTDVEKAHAADRINQRKKDELVSREADYNRGTPSPEAAAPQPFPMEERETIIQSAAELLSRVYPKKAVKKALADLAASAAGETTERAPAELRPARRGSTPIFATEGNAALAVVVEAVTLAKPKLRDWIEAREQGAILSDFIKEKFETELASGEMHRGLLSRYEELQSDFYSLSRSKLFPAWLMAIPLKTEWNKRQVAEGKVRPKRPSLPRTDETRAYERQRKLLARHRIVAVTPE